MKRVYVVGFDGATWRFIQPLEGMLLYERTSATWAAYRSGAWEVGLVRGAAMLIDGVQVVGPRDVAIDSPSGGAVVDTEARTAIAALLGTLRRHGLIES